MQEVMIFDMRDFLFDSPNTKTAYFFSNTDAIHIETFEQMEPLFYSDFYNCFEKSISPLKWDANKL
jgi:hypothetical protein